MIRKRLPAGWDEEKVHKVLAHYEEQTEDDALVEVLTISYPKFVS